MDESYRRAILTQSIVVSLRLQCLEKRLLSTKAVEKMFVGQLKKEVPAFEHRSRLYEFFRKIKIDAERLPTKIIFRVIG